MCLVRIRGVSERKHVRGIELVKQLLALELTIVRHERLAYPCRSLIQGNMSVVVSVKDHPTLISICMSFLFLSCERFKCTNKVNTLLRDRSGCFQYVRQQEFVLFKFLLFIHLVCLLFWCIFESVPYKYIVSATELCSSAHCCCIQMRTYRVFRSFKNTSHRSILTE